MGQTRTVRLGIFPPPDEESRRVLNPAAGRGWEETEECIDPQSGLLQVHSEAPGRYAVYDYSNAPQLGGHRLPRSVTVTEAGRIFFSSLEKDEIESTGYCSIKFSIELTTTVSSNSDQPSRVGIGSACIPAKNIFGFASNSSCIFGVI